MTVAALPDEVFVALAHPTRRRLLDLLLERDLPVKQLAGSFELSRPAVSQHLRVLLDSGLVGEQRAGRERLYHLRPERLLTVHDWLSKYEQFWRGRFQELHRYLEEQQRAANSDTDEEKEP